MVRREEKNRSRFTNAHTSGSVKSDLNRPMVDRSECQLNVGHLEFVRQSQPYTDGKRFALSDYFSNGHFRPLLGPSTRHWDGHLDGTRPNPCVFRILKNILVTEYYAPHPMDV